MNSKFLPNLISFFSSGGGCTEGRWDLAGRNTIAVVVSGFPSDKLRQAFETVS